MDIDPDLANWVMEFLLRQPLDDGTLKSLVRILPLRHNDPNLKKLLLLKKLELDASSDSISEETLESLEQLGEMEFRRGSGNVSDAMRRAYCALAVESTVKAVANQDVGDGASRFRYFEMVKRVWRGKMGRMKEVVGQGGLGSDELWAWKEEIEAAVWDDDVYDEVMRKSLEVNGGEAIESYVREEREGMGPSFLEVVAARMKDGEFMQGAGIGFNCAVEKEKWCDGGGLIDDGRSGKKEFQKGKIHLRNKVVGLQHSRGSAFGNSRRATIVDSNEMTSVSSCWNYNLRSAEVHRVREALELSSLELQSVVKDPLPEALQYAEAISNDTREHRHHHPVKENCFEANTVDGAGAHQPVGCEARRENGHRGPVEENSVDPNVVNGAGVDQAIDYNAGNVHRSNLMERNASDHSYERDDSFDRSQDSQADFGGRFLLPSPEVINASPLSIYQSNNFKRRRLPRKWSPLEEEALRAGVQQYGKGNWKGILAAYRDKFVDRTEVDLKDKWRNMTKH